MPVQACFMASGAIRRSGLYHRKPLYFNGKAFSLALGSCVAGETRGRSSAYGWNGAGKCRLVGLVPNSPSNASFGKSHRVAVTSSGSGFAASSVARLLNHLDRRGRRVRLGLSPRRWANAPHLRCRSGRYDDDGATLALLAYSHAARSNPALFKAFGA